MQREINIGRARDCDIYIDERCVFASSRHGKIYSDGTKLMFADHSTNGTVVNGVWIKNRVIPIRPGDQILIAGKYPLNWNQILRYFPNGIAGNAQNINYGQNGTYMNPIPMPNETSEPVPNVTGNPNISSSTNNSNDEQPKTGSWSWAGFTLYPIWGFFNGCWWAFLVSIFFGWTFIPNIIFGISGRRWAWENRTWSSARSFNETQRSWDNASIAILIISIIIVPLIFISVLGLFASLI
jgi:transposase